MDFLRATVIHIVLDCPSYTDDRRARTLETPMMVNKGKKQMNPYWKYLPEWGYRKAPTTKDHKFSPHNHNWTAGVLYPEKDACWVGCASCAVQCLSRDQNVLTELCQLGDCVQRRSMS